MVRRLFGGFVASALVACSAPNPKSCADGNCTDPEFAFCDVNGTLGGVPGECIAPVCTAGELAECRGDVEVRCSPAGDNFDLVSCERGCEPEIGCRLCDPGETACTNGIVATCDAAGNASQTETCALGCFEDEPRCREIEPSNDLAMYLDMVDDPPDLDLSSGGMIDSSTGGITTAAGATLVAPSFLAPPIEGAPGVMIRVVIARDVRLGDVNVVSSAPGGPALAILARGTIEVVGRLDVRAGDMAVAGCMGGSGKHENPAPKVVHSAGSGGGGHATDGGRGGDYTADPGLAGGSRGLSSGNIFLAPLRGGCASGGVTSTINPATAIGARGGGAIQLTSRRSIRIAGTIDVAGETGFEASGAYVGGGAGGGVLVEAPEVAIESGGILANGGDGVTCVPMQQPARACGTAGVGGHFELAATDGGAITGVVAHGGSGGGGLGRIRINTADGTYTKNTGVREDGLLTTGILQTR